MNLFSWFKRSPAVVLVREPGLTVERLRRMAESWEIRGRSRVDHVSPMQEGYGYGLLSAAEELRNVLRIESGEAVTPVDMEKKNET